MCRQSRHLERYARVRAGGGSGGGCSVGSAAGVTGAGAEREATGPADGEEEGGRGEGAGTEATGQVDGGDCGREEEQAAAGVLADVIDAACLAVAHDAQTAPRPCFLT